MSETQQSPPPATDVDAVKAAEEAAKLRARRLNRITAPIKERIPARQWVAADADEDDSITGAFVDNLVGSLTEEERTAALAGEQAIDPNSQEAMAKKRMERFGVAPSIDDSDAMKKRMERFGAAATSNANGSSKKGGDVAPVVVLSEEDKEAMARREMRFAKK